VDVVREENSILKDKLKAIENHTGERITDAPAPTGGSKITESELKVSQPDYCNDSLSLAWTMR